MGSRAPGRRHIGLITWVAGTAALVLAACQPAPPPVAQPTAPPPGPVVVAPSPTVPGPVGTLPPISAGSGKSWALTFNDDFDGSSLNTSNWTPCFSWAQNLSACTTSFNNGRERYQPGQVRISGGTAKLVAEPVPGGDGGNPPKTYRSGLLSTTNKPASTGQPGSLFSFRYGYAEARLKVPSQRGFFTAWWLLPPDPGRYDYPYEIDVLEHLGGGDRIAHMTLHHSDRSDWWSPNTWGPNGNCSTFDPAAGFHTYGVDWQPSSIAFYVDGQECGRFTGPVWNGQMELILNLMVDVDWQRATGVGLADPTLSATLEVDHVRVWQRQ